MDETVRCLATVAMAEAYSRCHHCPVDSLQVRPIDPLADPRWDRFVESHQRATVYHLGAWAEILSRAYGYEPRYLSLEERDGAIRGVMPLLAKRGPVSGRRLRSMPVVEIGGPAGESPDCQRTLAAAACELAEAERRTLIFDSFAGGLDRGAAALRTIQRPPVWILPLPEDSEGIATWRSARSKNLKRSIKKAATEEVEVREHNSERDLRRFYRLYLAAMRRHRSLPRRLRQLELSMAMLGERGAFRLFLAERRGRLLAGAVYHTFHGTIELLYNASEPAALPLRPNHALYLRAIEWGVERGYERFDFGFAWPESSLGAFKAQWGAAEVPVHRYVSGAAEDGAGPPPAEAGPRKAVDAVWGHAPLALTRLAGVVAYRYL
jgi:serine/alanine adding enzyme